ncbi:MAG: hypothetical protein DCC55_39985 [Chloroflexi bacterium]|nr:MAG: hypothetical protein DCC55_39985 [Chloroflexota bacterium]
MMQINKLTLSDEDRQVLTRLEESMWRAETRFDRQFMEQAFAPDCFEYGRSGRTYTREQLFAMLPAPIDAMLPLPNLTIRLLDENTAHVTYNSAVTYDGVVEYGRRSSIWSRTENGWVMRFHQGTPYTA